MQEFNPYFRPSAAEILKSPIFDKIRVPALEDIDQYKINVTNFVSNHYDYENNELKGDIDES